VRDFREAVEEWLLLVLTFPLVFVFLPGCTEQIQRGFDALHHAPQWFEWAVGGAITFAFGRRTFRGLRMPSFGKRSTKAPATPPPAQAPGS
jgi:hypothetical protein